jgi:hypothetical protein
MNALKSFKKLWLILIITMFLSTMSTSIAFADDPIPPTPDTNPTTIQGKTVPTDPNRILSPEEIKFSDAKNRALEQYLQERKSKKSIISPLYIQYVLLPVGTWKEPEDHYYDNYCGPGATEVALDARWTAAQVKAKGIIGIGIAEKTNDPYIGTDMGDIVRTLNSPDYLGGEFPNGAFLGYELSLAQNRDDLGDKLTFDIDSGYAMITGVMTTNMPGWNGYTARHIVAVIGYKINTSYDNTYVYYTETASTLAGYSGAYRRTVLLNNFFNFVLGLNTLAW